MLKFLFHRSKFHFYKLFYFIYNSIQVQFSKKIKVLSKEESLDTILKSKSSISRFGDGELRLINGESIEFQEYLPELSDRLKEVLKSNLKDHKICIVGVFGSLVLHTKIEKYFWTKHLSSYRKVWLKYLSSDKVYLDTYITRPYMGYQDKTTCGTYFNQFKTLWEKRKVLIVEGESTRFGISNDLLENALSIERILCPSINAYYSYDKIRSCILKLWNNHLVLVALGPTATIMAYDLARNGIQTIDIGHLDIEYEWYRMNAKEKVKIKGKYTNEATYDKNIKEICEDKNYHDQVIQILLS